jgi:hypothetical protein
MIEYEVPAQGEINGIARRGICKDDEVVPSYFLKRFSRLIIAGPNPNPSVTLVSGVIIILCFEDVHRKKGPLLLSMTIMLRAKYLLSRDLQL